MQNDRQEVALREEATTQTFLSTRQLQIILGIVFIATIIIATVDWISERRMTTIYGVAPLALMTLISFFLLQSGIRQPAQIMVPLAALIGINYILIVGGGIHDTSLISFIAVLLLANLTLSGYGPLVFGGLIILSVVTLGMLEINGIVTNKFSHITDYADVVIIPTIIVAIAGLQRILVSRLTNLLNLAKEKEQEQNLANAELRELRKDLEMRVEERTTELEKNANQLQKRATQFETIAQLARTINSIQDPSTLLHKITQLVSTSFGFYHSGLFLLDESRQYAVLNAANSAGGQKMLERGHRLKVGSQGIVGYVTSTGNPRIALDTGADAVFFENPDLPETRSEMALPLRVGTTIVGALDVQSTEPNAFSEDDVEVLSILADVVSVAIENARLFEESQRVLAEAQTAFSESTLEAWRQINKKRKTIGYTLSGVSIRPLEKPLKNAEIHKAIKTGKVTVPPNRKKTKVLAVPIKLRDQIIGTMKVSLPEGQEWDSDEVDITQALADRVGIAIESATLLEESRRRAERERLVSDITVKIRSTNDPEAMIQTALDELKNALGATTVQLIPHTIQKTDAKVKIEEPTPTSDPKSSRNGTVK